MNVRNLFFIFIIIDTLLTPEESCTGFDKNSSGEPIIYNEVIKQYVIDTDGQISNVPRLEAEFILTNY